MTISYYYYIAFVALIFYWFLTDQTVQGDCLANGIQYVDDADVRFALMLQLRSDESESLQHCEISPMALQHYLTVEWLIDRINSFDNNTGYIPGVKIGYTSYDDCGESLYSARNSVSFLNNSLTYMSSTCATQTETVPHIAIIGPGSSSSALTVSSLLKDHPIPIISPLSTVAELSDKNLYPTFLRTVPSDIQQMALIIDMLEKLQWTYITVVYQNDDYGRSGKNILTKKAKERGICIHKEDLILPQDDGDLGNHFEDILMGASGHSIAVVVIANSIRAEQFLYALETRVSSKFRRGLHFILMDAVNTDVSIFKDSQQGQGTLSISTASDLLQMHDLKTHLNEKFRQFASQPDDHALIKEYIETHGHPDTFIPEHLDAFLPATINAVMALVESLKHLHSDSCLTKSCDLLKTRLKNGELMKRVKETQVNYLNVPKGIVPEIFHDNQLSFSFDSDGDIVVGGSNPSYTIYSYDANDENYKYVGSYTNGKMSLKLDLIKWLSPLGVPISGVPTSMCTGDACKDCQNNGLIPVMFLEGDIYIVGIFAVHDKNPNDPFKCGAYRSIAYDAVSAEGFLFAIEELRTKTGIRFGAIGFDGCYSHLRMTSILTDYFSDLSPLHSEMFPHKISREKIVGVIGCLSSGCTIPITRFFTPLNLPVMSYASSSPDLDDRVDFPYFLRTVPSDVYQAQVMVNVIKKMGWEYVGLLYVNNNYGAKGMKAFRKLVDAEGSGICAAKEIAISDKETIDDIFEARRILTRQRVRVVVFFGIDTRFPDFIKNYEKYQADKNYIFLASEDWGINEDIKNAGAESTLGSITLKLKKIGLESEEKFKEHLMSKRPSSDNNNVWFREYWQNLFQCHFRGGFHHNFQRECDMNQKLNDTQVEKSVSDQRVRHLINAVFAMGKGLNEKIKQYCRGDLESCDYLHYLHSNPSDVVEQIKKQTRYEGSEQLPIFDEDGNGAIGFDVFNIQGDTRSSQYVHVGTVGLHTQDLRLDALKFYKEGDRIDSWPAVCEKDMCRICPHMKVPQTTAEPQKNYEVVASDYRDSDILLISLIGVLILAVAVIVVVVIICVKRKYKVFEKKLESRDEQIYDEPIRRVYPGHSLPMGVNLPFSNPDISPYVTNVAFNRDGVANPTFLSDSDRIESVSQVIANRGMNIEMPYSTSASGNVTSQNSILSQAPSYPNSNPPEVSYMYQTEHNEDSDLPVKPWAHAADSATRKENSVVYSPIAVTSMPLNATSLQASQNSHFNSDNVLLAKGPNGQIIAYIPSEDAQPPLNTHPLASQTSFNTEYGPYSRAAALQRQQAQASAVNQEIISQNMYGPQPSYPIVKEMSALQGSEAAAVNYGQIPYENIELQNLNSARKDMNINNPSQGEITSMKQYAHPTHIISAPNVYSTAIPSTHSNTMKNVPSNASPEVHSYNENASTMDPSFQNMLMARAPNQMAVPQEELPTNSWQDCGEMDNDLRIKGEGQQRLYGYPDSNSLSSIPDVISGKMPYNPTTPLKMKREVSLESIDLDTNTDLDHDQYTPQKKPRTFKRDRMETASQNSVISIV